MNKKEIIYGSAISFVLLAIGVGIYFLTRKNRVMLKTTTEPEVLPENNTNSGTEVFIDETPVDLVPSPIEVLNDNILPPFDEEPMTVTDIAPAMAKMDAEQGVEYRKAAMANMANMLTFNLNESIAWYARRNYGPYSPLLFDFLMEVENQQAIDEFLRYSV